MRLRFHESKRALFAKATVSTVQVTKIGDGSGAGVILTADGLILTAWHIITRSRIVRIKRLHLSKKGWHIYSYGSYIADVIYRDKKADIALVKMRRPPPDLIPAVFGDSDTVTIGTPLFRVGRDNDGQFLGEGYVYALGHEDRIPELSISMHADAGSSGSQVFTMEGVMVGLGLRGIKDEKYPHVCYAIPTNVVRRRLFRLAEVKPYLTSPLTPEDEG